MIIIYTGVLLIVYSLIIILMTLRDKEENK